MHEVDVDVTIKFQSSRRSTFSRTSPELQNMRESTRRSIPQPKRTINVIQYPAKTEREALDVLTASLHHTPVTNCPRDENISFKRRRSVPLTMVVCDYFGLRLDANAH
jgi:hypothetical protein